MKTKYLVLIAVSGFIIALDQASKIYVHTHFLLEESLTVIPQFFDLTYVRNPGAAFGLFRDAHPLFRKVFFSSLPPLAVIFIIFILRDTKENEKLQITALSLISGGALGNYVDRLRFGYVIDFIDVHFKRIYTWPAFNIADSAIVIGVGILVLCIIFQGLEAHKENTQRKPQKS